MADLEQRRRCPRAQEPGRPAGDTAGADAAQVEIDTAEAEARRLGEQDGFADCGQFLDAGQAPTTGGGDGHGHHPGHRRRRPD